MKKNTILKDALILTVITLIAGGLLGLVYEVTKKPIANQQEKAKQEAYKAVFEDADSFEVCVEAEDADLAEALKEQGFDCSMDDFGSGYSSLNPMKSLPVSVIKLIVRCLAKKKRNVEKSSAEVSLR